MMEETAPGPRVDPGPGQYSVWDYPRPPIVEPDTRRFRVYVAGIPIIDTTNAIRVLETGHPPTVYIPRQAFRHCEIRRLKHQWECEFKGTATFFTLIAGGKISHRAAWEYLNPHGQYRALLGHLAVHPGRVDRAVIDDEEVQGEEDDVYGGWISRDVVGPFVGEAGNPAAPGPDNDDEPPMPT